ncbi:hypothetical protein M5689_003849 [Euphorbia peplus]|nr:hypothetical protein M5689_003849 [Euphorbia peplus]
MGFKINVAVAVYLAMVIMVAAAHDGEDHAMTPGMVMPPADPPSSSNLVSPAMLLPFFAALLSFLFSAARLN